MIPLRFYLSLCNHQLVSTPPIDFKLFLTAVKYYTALCEGTILFTFFSSQELIDLKTDKSRSVFLNTECTVK